MYKYKALFKVVNDKHGDRLIRGDKLIIANNANVALNKFLEVEKDNPLLTGAERVDNGDIPGFAILDYPPYKVGDTFLEIAMILKEVVED